LQDNKKSWHSKLTSSLWADRVSTKKYIGTSPFQLVYGTDIIFLASLESPMKKFLQEQHEESDPIQRQISQLVEVQQIREGVFDKAQSFQDKMKNIFDRRTKRDDFQQGDLVLKWDARYEDKGNHGKFDCL
jgi:hypothetical protein